MGLRGPKPGQYKTRPRDANGHWLPIAEPIKNWSTEVVLASIEKSFGLKTQVARDLGMNLNTVTRYAADIQAIRDAFWGQDERINDLAELGLIAAIQRGEAWAICFRLKTKARDRGYVERTESFDKSAALVLHANIPAGEESHFDHNAFIALFRHFAGQVDGNGLGLPPGDGAGESLDTT